MSFGAPLGLFALAALPVLVVLYFFRRRSEPRVVSALFLWKSTEDPAPSGPRWWRLNRRFSLLLELLAALALVAFVADVRCSTETGSQKHTVVVLDGSLSMQARQANGRALYQIALETVRSRLRQAGGTATVIVTGSQPRVLAGPAIPVSEAIGMIETWLPSEPSHPFEPAWTLARELAGPHGALLFVTDALPSAPPPALEVVALGTPLSNVGFVAASRDDASDGTRVHLRVANFASRDWSGAFHLSDDAGKALRDHVITIGGGETVEVSEQFPRSPVLTASLPDDALAWDNVVTLEPDPLRVVHVRNDLPAESAGAEAVGRFLAAASGVELTGAPELTIRPAGNGAAPEWSLTIGVDAGAKTRAFLGPFVGFPNDPLLEDVIFDGAVWPAGSSPSGRALLTAGDVTLLSESAGHRYRMNVDLAQTNLVRMAAWPVLLANLVDLRRGATPGFPRHNVIVGEDIRVVTGAGRWGLAGENETRVLSQDGEVLSLHAGSYDLVNGSVRIDRVRVNALDAAESDLRTCGSGARAAQVQTTQSALLPRERSQMPLLLALLLLLADYALAVPGPGRRPARGA
jgi:hypothetical protein